MSTTPKYTNQTQFEDGVADVDEQLSQGEQLVLNALAQRGDYHTFQSHPGNAKLIRRARVGTRQGLNYILKKLEAKKLISKISDGDGGRGLATVYRIRVEDLRFPIPERKALKPASDSLQVSEPSKPASNNLQVLEPQTRKCDNENPQVDADKPASTGTLNPQVASCTLPLMPSFNLSFNPSLESKEEEVEKPPRTPLFGSSPKAQQRKTTNLPSWIFRIWEEANHCVLNIYKTDKMNFDRFISEHGLIVSVIAWAQFLQAENSPCRLEPLEIVDQHVSKSGAKWQTARSDESVVTRFPLALFLSNSNAKGCIEMAKGMIDGRSKARWTPETKKTLTENGFNVDTRLTVTAELSKTTAEITNDKSAGIDKMLEDAEADYQRTQTAKMVAA